MSLFKQLFCNTL